MFGFEESVEAQAAVAAVPEPQFPRGRGRVRFVVGGGAVGVEVVEDALTDLVQGGGGE